MYGLPHHSLLGRRAEPRLLWKSFRAPFHALHTILCSSLGHSVPSLMLSPAPRASSQDAPKEVTSPLDHTPLAPLPTSILLPYFVPLTSCPARAICSTVHIHPASLLSSLLCPDCVTMWHQGPPRGAELALHLALPPPTTQSPPPSTFNAARQVTVPVSAMIYAPWSMCPVRCPVLHAMRCHAPCCMPIPMSASIAPWLCVEVWLYASYRTCTKVFRVTCHVASFAL